VEAGATETTAERPNGPVVAGLLAAGIGALVLGVLTTVAEASESFGESLQYNDRVGPLSGKVIWATAAFVVSWVALGVRLQARDLEWRPVLIVTGVLVALGILGTFPTFFQAFASE
jgi:hypothetical protein